MTHVVLRSIRRDPVGLGLVAALAALSVAFFTLPFSGETAAPAQIPPYPYPGPSGVTSIVVRASDIRAVRPGGAQTRGFTTVIEGPVTFDLIAVRDIEDLLGGGPLDPGKYNAMRMTIESVVVTRDGEEIIANVPSGVLKLAGSIEIEAGKTTTAVFRFEASRSLVFKSDGSVQFKPVVKLSVRKPGKSARLQVARAGMMPSSSPAWTGRLISGLQQPGTLEIAVTDVSGEGLPITSDVSLEAGLNLIGIPVGLATTTTASGLAQEIADQGGEVAQVIRWDEGSQSYVLWSAASPLANDFELEEGRGYFVLVVTPPTTPVTGAWRATGSEFAQGVPITFVVGLNLISTPFQTPVTGYDTVSFAQAVADQGGQVAQIIRWDALSQAFVLWSAASPGANIFAIDGGAQSGYFVLIIVPTTLPFVP